MRNHRDLQVWNKAYALTLEIYKVSRSFPKEELYGLTSQMRRAAIFVGANLAEGCGRRSNAEMGRFVRMAMGSAAELDHHLLPCKDLGFLSEVDHRQFLANLTEVRKMLSALLDSITNELETKARAATKG